MYFSEFLLLIVSAIIVTLVLMMIGEKVILLIIPTDVHPLYRIVGSFAFAIILISIFVSGFNMETGINLYLLSGAIILLNKYWFGHFSKENVSQ
ncbi:hypothetical protein [Sporosarcina sp. G11-34]|uniref:hypothetical protein n=1 Tax=Sporosarcina sp. G11-34 TaxID=2849605 RepID=UPI0022A92830|nr:hypothetical protein [Sporosarcina sp. G11-34]MCZ2260298.1 hypothetical protein [Sporosarcina sp. G11-34]